MILTFELILYLEPMILTFELILYLEPMILTFELILYPEPMILTSELYGFDLHSDSNNVIIIIIIIRFGLSYKGLRVYVVTNAKIEYVINVKICTYFWKGRKFILFIFYFIQFFNMHNRIEFSEFQFVLSHRQMNLTNHVTPFEAKNIQY